MFINESVQAVWQDIQGFKERHKKAALMVLEKLDTSEGDISSVVFHWSESPYKKINVRDHTIGVVREIMKREDPHMPMFPLMVLAALGHDVGKLPCGHLDRRVGKYYERMHAQQSAKMILRWFREVLPVQELDLVVKAVDLHHDRGEHFTLLDHLKQADQAERINELNYLYATGHISDTKMIANKPQAPGAFARREDVPPVKFPDPTAEKLPFFAAGEFLRRLKPHVNSWDAYTGLGPEAVSMPNGVCYFTTNRILKIVREWAHEVGYGPLLDSIGDWKVNPDRIKNVIAFIGVQLREIEALAEFELPPGYTYRKFRVTVKCGKFSEEFGMYYVPIKSKFFCSNIAQLEGLKKGTEFKDVKRIEMDMGPWKKKEICND